MQEKEKRLEIAHSYFQISNVVTGFLWQVLFVFHRFIA